MTKAQSIREAYRKARHALVQRRSYWRKKGVPEELLPQLPGKPKKITAGSVRRLQKISLKPTQKALPGIDTAKEPDEDIPSMDDIVWNNIMGMLDAVPMSMSAEQAFYNASAKKHGGRRLSEINATRIVEILRSAESRLGRAETIDRLKAAYGDRIQYELERIAYAEYDKDYSRWGGRGYSAAMSELRAALA